MENTYSFTRDIYKQVKVQQILEKGRPQHFEAINFCPATDTRHNYESSCNNITDCQLAQADDLDSDSISNIHIIATGIEFVFQEVAIIF